eukprot:scaffold146_cov265-Pinguiococcus_pyrenoidosus.AAC.19
MDKPTPLKYRAVSSRRWSMRALLAALLLCLVAVSTRGANCALRVALDGSKFGLPSERADFTNVCLSIGPFRGRSAATSPTEDPLWRGHRAGGLCGLGGRRACCWACPKLPQLGTKREILSCRHRHIERMMGGCRSPIFSRSLYQQQDALLQDGSSGLQILRFAQVPAFHSDFDKLRFSLNQMLPDDLRVLAAVPVPNAFHSGKDATGYAWRYVIDASPLGDPLLRYFAWRPSTPSWGTVVENGGIAQKMRAASQAWLGCHGLHSAEVREGLNGDAILIDLEGSQGSCKTVGTAALPRGQRASKADCVLHRSCN